MKIKKLFIVLASIILAACASPQTQAPPALPEPTPVIVTTITVESGQPFCYTNTIDPPRDMVISINPASSSLDVSYGGSEIEVWPDPSFMDPKYAIVVEKSGTPNVPDLTIMWIHIRDDGKLDVSNPSGNFHPGKCGSEGVAA